MAISRSLGNLENNKPAKLQHIAADVTRKEEVGAAIAAVKEKHGRIDVAVLAAGVTLIGRTEDQELEDWERVVKVNISGVLNCAHPLMKIMVEQRSGTIILIGFIAGMGTPEYHAVYAPSKTLVEKFGKTGRRSLRKYGVRVMVMCPGVAEGTDIFTTGFTDEESPKNFGKMVKDMGKTLTPENVADAIFACHALGPNIVQPTTTL